MNKLNLGCGYVMPDDWTNVDKLDYGGNVVADILEGLPYPDDHFDFVLMNHTLQMFTYEELPLVLKEVRRVMNDKAKLRILVPDIAEAVKKCREGDKSYFPISDDIESTISGKCLRYIYWHGDARCGFDYEALKNKLESNNFVKCRLPKFGQCELDSREAESLIMTCQK